MDHDRVSSAHFKTHYVAPPDMSFSKSDAFFQNADLEIVLAKEFERQCKVLCFGEFPSWKQFQRQFKEIRELL